MSTRSNQMAFALSSAVILVILCGGKAFCQSTASPKPATNSSPSVVHYHYHYHYHPPMSSLLYPRFDADPYNGMAPNARYPLPPTAFSPTQANPYPAGYIPGAFAPTGFQNLNPNAPSARGVIHVFLPTKVAVVYLNGQKMRGTGKDRKFTTPVLPSNQEYQYWVTATFVQNGESVTEYRKVVLGAGEYNVADFTRPPEENVGRLPSGPVDPNTVAPDNK